jgi:hypothetical protein
MKTKSIIISLTILLNLGIGIFPCFADSNIPPSGHVDLAKYDKGIFYALGWAADKTDGAPMKKVEIYVDGKLVGAAKLGLLRPGLGVAAKNPSWEKAGWEISHKMSLKSGSHLAYMTTKNKHGVLFKSNEMKFDVK